MKHRLVRFMSNVGGQETVDMSDDDDVGVQYSTTRPYPDKPKQCDTPETRLGPNQISLHPAEVKQESHSPRRYPSRERRRPDIYGVESDQAQIHIDYCYKMVSNVPQTFREAVTSSNSREWADAIDEEIKSLREQHIYSDHPT